MLVFIKLYTRYKDKDKVQVQGERYKYMDKHVKLTITNGIMSKVFE